MSDRASISRLSPELVAMIVSHLEMDDLFNLQLSCRYHCESSLLLFIERHFQTRVHILTQHSLATLAEISRHPIFGPSIRTLEISRKYDSRRSLALFNCSIYIDIYI